MPKRSNQSLGNSLMAEPWRLAVVIPTRDRLTKLGECLDALSKQKSQSFTVFVIASGTDAEGVISKYKQCLDITYLFTKKRGQITQRNIGIKLALGSGVDYVGFLDDDVIIEADGFNEIERFITDRRDQGEIDFGLGFNVIEEETDSAYGWKDRIKQVLEVVGSQPGSITKAGFTEGFSNLSENIQTGWLTGGATIWSRNILKEFPQKSLVTSHAGGEDLRYSYPIGKRYPLYACARIKIVHNEVESRDLALIRSRHKADTVARLFFCDQHPEFSGLLCIGVMLIFSIADLVFGGKKSWVKLIAFGEGVAWYFQRKKRGAQVLEID
jgi:glycosyltransferase involved in cell wall biosynthesis